MADTPEEQLHRIAAGETDRLELDHLDEAVGSLAELIRLLDWLSRHGATLSAEQPPLDTATAQGRHTEAVLREIERWERPRGRPGVKHIDPKLAERIAHLRESGLGLHAIARALNDEGLPTPRGGTQWRASSVQAALGYKRPPPPPKGAPPPPPPHHHPPPPRPPHHRGHPPKP